MPLIFTTAYKAVLDLTATTFQHSKREQTSVQADFMLRLEFADPGLTTLLSGLAAAIRSAYC
jgi:hypothetical protein